MGKDDSSSAAFLANVVHADTLCGGEDGTKEEAYPAINTKAKNTRKERIFSFCWLLLVFVVEEKINAGNKVTGWLESCTNTSSSVAAGQKRVRNQTNRLDSDREKKKKRTMEEVAATTATTTTAAEDPPLSLDDLRQMGNHHFSNGNYDTALSLYTAAVEKADEQGNREALVLNLCNRSACWFKMERYEEAQDDSSQAVDVSQGKE